MDRRLLSSPLSETPAKPWLHFCLLVSPTICQLYPTSRFFPREHHIPVPNIHMLPLHPLHHSSLLLSLHTIA